jgi:hypothetical protein
LRVALRAKLPAVVPNIGVFPERVGGRPWTWVLPWDLSPEAWCGFFQELRLRLLAGDPPARPPVLATAAADFYPGEYLAAEGLS